MTIQSELVTSPPAPGAEENEFGTASHSQGRIALGRFARSWTAMGALVVFTVIIVFSYVYPPFYRWDFSSPDLKAQSVHPGQQGHILGTDGTGFDLFAQIMRGTQRDFIIVVVSTLIAVVIGVLIGAVAGYYGNVLDNVLMRFVDVMLSVPSLVILIVVANHYQGLGAFGLAILIGLFGWMGLSRLIRAQFMSLREREFIEAAHAMGASSFRIIVRHLIPNVLSTILVFGSLFAAVSIIAETSLTFLGFGVHPPDTSLGLLISNGVGAIDTRSWLFYYPGILILIIVLSVNLIGEGIRNAFDPRNTRVRD